MTNGATRSRPTIRRWAGGIVYAVGSRGCGVPNVFNRELEEAFGTKMSTIYKRAAQIRRLLDF